MKSAYLLFALAALNTGFCLGPNESMLALPENHQLIINNRILAKVNDKTISVIDVMKKMEFFLVHNYPQMAESKTTRFQFFSTNWQYMLSQMIDNELILADADGKDLKITEGEIRETLQERFGPNVLANLDKLGITFDEAKKMIENEMTVQRMTWYKAQVKAVHSINPQDVKNAYKEYCTNNPSVEEWKYQVLTVRAPDHDKGAMIADKAFELLQQKVAFDVIPELLKEKEPLEETVSVALSADYVADEKSISKSYKDILSTLTPSTFSKPTSQINRVDKTEVFRIFYLKDHHKKELPPFEQMANQLQEELVQKAIAKETEAYITRLRERLGYDYKHMQEALPSDFQPFVMN